MSSIADHIYGADLRDRLIPCGNCEDPVSDLESVRQHVQRLDTELDGHEQENARTITELSTTVKHISVILEKQAHTMEDLDKRFAGMERKLDKYNNLRERTDSLEKSRTELSVDYVPRREFNGMVGSLRREIGAMKWIFGIGFTAVVGLLSGLIVILIGG